MPKLRELAPRTRAAYPYTSLDMIIERARWSTPKLPKFHLVKDTKQNNWKLEPEGGGRARARFETKGEATAGGTLSGALGKAGGSVRIHKTDGTIQEERTFPRSRDPKDSKG